MRTTFRRVATGAGLAAAGLGLAGAALAAGPGDHAGPRSSVALQRGAVLSCHGTGVRVTVYDSSAYGSTLVVFVGGPGEERFGSLERDQPFLVDRAVEATVELAGGGTVTVGGTATPRGLPTRYAEPADRAGERVDTRGSRQPLATDLAVTVDGTRTRLRCASAFAFELEVRRTRLYGR